MAPFPCSKLDLPPLWDLVGWVTMLAKQYLLIGLLAVATKQLSTGANASGVVRLYLSSPSTRVSGASLSSGCVVAVWAWCLRSWHPVLPNPAFGTASCEVGVRRPLHHLGVVCGSPSIPYGRER